MSTPVPKAVTEEDEPEGGADEEAAEEADDSEEAPEGVDASEVDSSSVEQDVADVPDSGSFVDKRLDDLNAATEKAEEEAKGETEGETEAVYGGEGGDSPFSGEETVDIDLANTNVGKKAKSSSPFSGSETPDESSSGGASAGMDFDDMTKDGDSDGSSAPRDGDDQLDQVIIEGFARAAVIGLEEEDRDGLQDEFEEVFEAFRLGHFGSEVVYEYVLIDEDDDVDPIWGFFGSMVLCAAVVVWMRPDGDEITQNVQSTMSDFVQKVK